MKCAVVTGANTGIGYETAKALAAEGFAVVMACRNEDKTTVAMQKIRRAHRDATLRFLPVDLVDRESIRNFAAMFREQYEGLSLLINNAGVLSPPYTITPNGLELQFDTNYMGHFYLTSLLFSCLEDDARIVILSSLASKDKNACIRFDNINFEGIYEEGSRFLGLTGMGAYRQSKLANVLFMMELKHRIEAAGKHITAAAAHPGASNTDIIRNMSPLIRFLSPVLQRMVNVSTPKGGARPIVYAAMNPTVKPGDFIGPTGRGERTGRPGPVPLPPEAFDEDLRRRLWEFSEMQLGVTFVV